MSVTTTSHKLKQEAQQEADITLLPLRADCSETAQLKKILLSDHQAPRKFLNLSNPKLQQQKHSYVGHNNLSEAQNLRKRTSILLSATPRSLLKKTTQLRNYIETSYDHQKFLHLLLQSHNLRLKIKMPATKSALPTRRAALQNLRKTQLGDTENPGNLPPGPFHC
jgi:hypothetical protein